MNCEENIYSIFQNCSGIERNQSYFEVLLQNLVCGTIAIERVLVQTRWNFSYYRDYMQNEVSKITIKVFFCRCINCG